MLFQNTIDHIDTEVTELLAQVEDLKRHQAQLKELDTLTDSTLGQLGDVVSKIGDYAPDAIASLKNAVLTLFDSGDDGNDGGNQPTNPTPQPNDDEPKLKSLNGVTGDCLTSADPLNKPHPHKAELDGRACVWASPFASPLACLLWEDTPLLGQRCQLTSHWEHDWELEPLDGQAWEIATPLCCLLSDAPNHNEDKGTNKAEGMAYIELVTHPENQAIAYQRRHDGEIICTYVGFRTKAVAQSWMHYVEAVTSRVELRSSKRMQGFKWEMKIKGMSVRQIERLATEDINKSYSTKPSQTEKIEAGDIVTQLLTPSHSYRVEAILPNGVLDCTNLTTSDRLGLRPAAVSLVQKASKYPPCPFQEGDLVDWRGLKLRVGAIGVETLHCVLRTDPAGTKPHTRVPITECVMSEAAPETREERNARIAKENQQMLNGMAATVFDQKFQQQNTRLSMGATHGR